MDEDKGAIVTDDDIARAYLQGQAEGGAGQTTLEAVLRGLKHVKALSDRYVDFFVEEQDGGGTRITLEFQRAFGVTKDIVEIPANGDVIVNGTNHSQIEKFIDGEKRLPTHGETVLELITAASREEAECSRAGPAPAPRTAARTGLMI